MSATTPKIGTPVAYRGPQNPDQAAIISGLNKNEAGEVESVDLTVFDQGGVSLVQGVEYGTDKYLTWRGVDEDFAEPGEQKDTGTGTVTPGAQPDPNGSSDPNAQSQEA